MKEYDLRCEAEKKEDFVRREALKMIGMFSPEKAAELYQKTK
jgi:hypothetical protein